MSARQATSILAALLASSCALAQTTWIVDATNGPGTSFTDVPAAVAAASSGDLLIVRPGNYTSFETNKGLTMLGGLGVRIARPQPLHASAVVVSGLPANETFTMLGFETVPATFLLPRIEVLSCAGKVHLEDIRIDGIARSLFQNGSPALRIENAASVVLARSRFRGQPGVLARGSTLIATDTECSGTDGLNSIYEFPAGHGIHAESSQITLSRCRAQGGTFFTYGPSSSAGLGLGLSSQLSTWTILGDATTQIVAGSAPGYVASAMTGSGSVRTNPAVAFVPSGVAPSISPAISVANLEIPSLRATGAPLGGSVSIDLFGLAGDAFGLFVGLPGDPIPLGALGELWIDLGIGPLFVAGGSIGAGRHFAMNVAVPNDPLVIGARFTWQGAGGSVANGIFLSNPATYVHP